MANRFLNECEFGRSQCSINQKDPVNMFAFVVIYILLNTQNTFANSTATSIQLRKSVQFSYDGANLFLDLIRGNASRNASEEMLEVYLGTIVSYYLYL